MTLDELKVEAKKLGYKLIKDTPYEKFLPCKCGYNRRELWCTPEGKFYYKCIRCGRKGGHGSTEKEAKHNWNITMKKVHNEVYKEASSS